MILFHHCDDDAFRQCWRNDDSGDCGDNDDDDCDNDNDVNDGDDGDDGDRRSNKCLNTGWFF